MQFSVIGALTTVKAILKALWATIIISNLFIFIASMKKENISQQTTTGTEKD